MAQPEQKVHSKEQILASVDSGGRSLSQHSQLGRNSSILSPRLDDWFWSIMAFYGLCRIYLNGFAEEIHREERSESHYH